MNKKKQNGYDIINIVWNQLPGYKKIWDSVDTKTKDNIINQIGKVSFQLNEPLYRRRELYSGFFLGFASTLSVLVILTMLIIVFNLISML